MKKRNTSGRIGREQLHPPRKATGSWAKRLCAMTMAGTLILGTFSVSMAGTDDENLDPNVFVSDEVLKNENTDATTIVIDASQDGESIEPTPDAADEGADLDSTDTEPHVTPIVNDPVVEDAVETVTDREISVDEANRIKEESENLVLNTDNTTSVDEDGNVTDTTVTITTFGQDSNLPGEYGDKTTTGETVTDEELLSQALKDKDPNAETGTSLNVRTDVETKTDVSTTVQGEESQTEQSRYDDKGFLLETTTVVDGSATTSTTTTTGEKTTVTITTAEVEETQKTDEERVVSADERVVGDQETVEKSSTEEIVNPTWNEDSEKETEYKTNVDLTGATMQVGPGEKEQVIKIADNWNGPTDAQIAEMLKDVPEGWVLYDKDGNELGVWDGKELKKDDAEVKLSGLAMVSEDGASGKQWHLDATAKQPAKKDGDDVLSAISSVEVGTTLMPTETETQFILEGSQNRQLVDESGNELGTIVLVDGRYCLQQGDETVALVWTGTAGHWSLSVGNVLGSQAESKEPTALDEGTVTDPFDFLADLFGWEPGDDVTDHEFVDEPDENGVIERTYVDAHGNTITVRKSTVERDDDLTGDNWVLKERVANDDGSETRVYVNYQNGHRIDVVAWSESYTQTIKYDTPRDTMSIGVSFDVPSAANLYLTWIGTNDSSKTDIAGAPSGTSKLHWTSDGQYQSAYTSIHGQKDDGSACDGTNYNGTPLHGTDGSAHTNRFQMKDSAGNYFFSYCSEHGRDLSSSDEYGAATGFSDPTKQAALNYIATYGYWDDTVGGSKLAELLTINDVLVKMGVIGVPTASQQTAAGQELKKLQNMLKGTAGKDIGVAVTQAAIWKFTDGVNTDGFKVGTQRLDNSTDEGWLLNTLYCKLIGTQERPAAAVELSSKHIEAVSIDITGQSSNDIFDEVSQAAQEMAMASKSTSYTADVSVIIALLPSEINSNDMRMCVYVNGKLWDKSVLLKDALDPENNNRYVVKNVVLPNGATVQVHIEGTQNMGKQAYLVESSNKHANYNWQDQILVSDKNSKRNVNMDVSVTFTANNEVKVSRSTQTGKETVRTTAEKERSQQLSQTFKVKEYYETTGKVNTTVKEIERLRPVTSTERVHWHGEARETFQPEPSEEPTPTPSEEPTPTPSEEPTPTPSEEPTPTPSEVPTPTPSEVPTPVRPSDEPTPGTPDTPTPSEPQSVNPAFPEGPQSQTLAETPDFPVEQTPTQMTLAAEPEWPEDVPQSVNPAFPEAPTQQTQAEVPEFPSVEHPEQMTLAAAPEWPETVTVTAPSPTVAVLRTRTTPVRRDEKSVPKTGDDSMMSLWYFLTFAAVITIAGGLFTARKAKKEVD